MSRLLDTLVHRVPERESLDLISDDDPNHARAVESHLARPRIWHTAYRNPPERRKGTPRDPETRARDAATFPVDLLHKLRRNWIADRRRESIAFGRRGEAVMERLAILRDRVARARPPAA